MKLVRFYIMIYMADLLFIYGSMMIYITDINNLDISGQRFIAVAGL